MIYSRVWAVLLNLSVQDTQVHVVHAALRAVGLEQVTVLPPPVRSLLLTFLPCTVAFASLSNHCKAYSSIATGNARISRVAHGPVFGAPTKRVDFPSSTPRHRAVTILPFNVLDISPCTEL